MTTEYEQVALAKMREAYHLGKPLVDQIMQNHTRVATMLSIFRGAIVLSSSPSKEEEMKHMLTYVDTIAAHMEGMIGAIGAMHGAAMMVNAIMSEHEDEKVADIGDKWEGADG